MKCSLEPLAHTATLSFAMAFAYFLSGVFTTEILTQHHIVTVVAFAPEGFALAGVLLFGRGVLPGIFLGQMLLALYQWSDMLGASFVGATNTAEAYLAWYLARRFKLDPALPTLRNVALLVMLIVVLLQPFSALLGNAALLWGGIIAPSHYPSSVFTWWLGNVMGQLLFTPTLLLLYREPSYRRWLTVIAVIIGVTVYVSALLRWEAARSPLWLTVLTLLPTVFIAYKDRTLGVVAVTALAVAAFYYAHIDQWPQWHTESFYHRLATLDLYLLVHLLAALIVGTIAKRSRTLNATK